MNVYECEYEYKGYTINVSSSTIHGAKRMAEDDADNYVDQAEEDEFAMRDLTRDIHINVNCELADDQDISRAENFDERNDEVTDELVY